MPQNAATDWPRIVVQRQSAVRRRRSASRGVDRLRTKRRGSMAADDPPNLGALGRRRAGRRGRGPRRRPAAAPRPARATCRGERRGRSRTAPRRPAGRCPDRGRCGGAENRRPARSVCLEAACDGLAARRPRGRRFAGAARRATALAVRGPRRSSSPAFAPYPRLTTATRTPRS